MGLLENMQGEPVSRLSLREPVTASATTRIRDAIERMRERQLGCVIVVDDERVPRGMFTESMLTQMLAKDPDVLDEPLRKHLSAHWPQVTMNDPIVDVLDAMQQHNVRFLSVVDEHGRLAGLTGQKGLMEYVAEHFPGQVMVQRIGGTPYLRQREGA